MSISVVQAQSSADLANSLTLGAGLTQGNWLVVAAADYGHSTITLPVSPVVGGVTIPAPAISSAISSAGSATVSYAIWILPVTAAMAGATAVTYNSGVNDGHIKCYAFELHSSTGKAIAPDWPASKSVIGTSGTSGTATGPSPTAAAGELAVYLFPVNAVNPNVSTGGWTVTGTQNYASAGYQAYPASDSTVSVTGSISATPHDWAIGLVTFTEVSQVWNGTIPAGTSSVATGARADGLQFKANSACTLQGIAFYVPSAETTLAGSSYTAKLYSTTNGTTGTLISTVAGSGTLIAGAWNWIYFTQALTSGTSYVAVIESPDDIQFVHNFWIPSGTQGDITAGPLTVPDTTDALGGIQQPFGSAGAFPASVNGSWYGVDVQVTTAAPAGISLFSQVAPTGTAGGAGATTGSYGLQFSVSSAAILEGLWFYSPSGSTAALPSVIALFDTSGNLVVWGTPSWSGAAGSGWIFASFAAPPTLKPSFNYVAAILQPFSSTAWNMTDSTYWSSGAGASGITHGIVSAPNNATAVHGQGSTVTGAALEFPNTSLAGANIWMDVQVTTAPASTYTVFRQNPVSDASTSDNSQYTMGMQFQVSSVSTANAVWFFSPYFPTESVELPETIGIYHVGTQALVHSETPTWSGPPGSGWVRAAFTSPPILNAATNYKVAILKTGGSNNWYAAETHYWDTGTGSSGITNGPLSAPNNAGALNGQTGGGGQDVFNAGSALNYPNTSFNAGNYWIDVEVTPGIFYRTGAESNTPSPANSETVTVPAGVVAGDLVVIYGQVAGAAGTITALNATTTGTALTPLDAGQQIQGGAGWDRVWTFIAGAGDPGTTVITLTSVGTNSGYIFAGLAAYAGAASVEAWQKINTGTATSSTFTGPTTTTINANDTAVYAAGYIAGGTITAFPGTQRQSDGNTTMSDSNGSVGPAGTSIGGAYTGSGSAPWTGWVLALTSASGGSTTHNGTAALTGTGTLTPSGTATYLAAAPLSGAGTLTPTGSKIVPGAASMSGTGTMAGTGHKQVPGATALHGTGLLTVAWIVQVPGAAGLGGTGVLHATGIAFGGTTVNGAAAFHAASILTCSYLSAHIRIDTTTMFPGNQLGTYGADEAETTVIIPGVIDGTYT